MIEAVVAKQEVGEAERLVASYARGAVEEADNLTTAMIAETGQWLQAGGAERSTEIVRAWWVNQIAIAREVEEAEEVDRRWSLAWGRDQSEFYQDLKARYARRRAEAKAAAGKPVVTSFSFDDPIADKEPATLSMSAPYDNARAYARRRCWKDGSLAVYAWGEQFWEWNGTTYHAMADEEMRRVIYEFLDGSLKIDGNGNQRVRFQPRPSQTSELLDCLRAGLQLPSWAEPPIWLDTGAHAGEVMMFQNGLVELATGALKEPTPKLWVHGGVGYEWRPEAPCPQWLAFLESIHPGDQEAQDCIEELLGYSMTEDVSFQKGVMLVGLPRSGKGTLLKIAEALVGSVSYVALDIHGWLKDDKSKEALLGKKVLAFPDVRMKPPKWFGQRLDPGGLDHRSVQELLKITAGDGDTISRKYIGPWIGTLPGKVWMALNQVPNFNDAVLPTRFIKIAFEVSYLGREDNQLTERLLREVSGIAGRCLRAYHRALGRKRLIQPRSGLVLADKIAQSSDPFTQFVEETLAADPKGTVICHKLFSRFQLWCAKHGREELLTSVTTKNIRKYINQVPGFEQVPKAFRPTGEQRRYSGIRLREREEVEDE